MQILKKLLENRDTKEDFVFVFFVTNRIMWRDFFKRKSMKVWFFVCMKGLRRVLVSCVSFILLSVAAAVHTEAGDDAVGSPSGLLL